MLGAISLESRSDKPEWDEPHGECRSKVLRKKY